MAGRKSKLSKVEKDLIAALQTGATDADVCTHVGIGQTTFYEWLAIGAAVIDGTEHPRMPEGDDDKQKFAEFAHAVTRARVAAKMTAIKTLTTALKPYTETSKTVKTYTETRLHKAVDQKTKLIVEVPYDHTEVTISETVAHHQADWRASVEFLKRRFPGEWGDKIHADITVNIELIVQVIEALQAANIDPSETFQRMIQKAHERTPIRSD